MRLGVFIISGVLCLMSIVLPCKGSTHCYDCSWGKKTCSCPGDGKSVYHSIRCFSEGWWRNKYCAAENNYYSGCTRYDLCKSCKTNLGREDMYACSSCRDSGFTGGKCNVDINECAKNNGGCEQICYNTQGSYNCKCRDGFTLDANKHTCTRRKCSRPPDVEGLVLRASSNWEFESYAEYSCVRLNQMTIGDHRRQCVVAGSSMVWAGEVPTCVALCDPKATYDQCGPRGIDAKVCEQLGCCYMPQNGTCHTTPGSVYISYQGYQPDTDDAVVQKADNVAHCRNICEVSESCRSFGIQQDYSSFTCFHYPGAREDYIKRMATNENAIYYEPLFFEDDTAWTDNGAVTAQAHHYGCFDVETTQQYLTVEALALDRYMTGIKCVDICRDLGFTYAAVHIDECRCGLSTPEQRAEQFTDDSNTTQCDIPCNSDRKQMCGGENHYTVLEVRKDKRNLGCYNETDVFLPIQLWHANANKSAEECIRGCIDHSFNYAGLMNGGDCYCSKEYGHATPVLHNYCSSSCSSLQNNLPCGGLGVFNIYSTRTAFDLGTSRGSHFTPVLYHDLDNLTSIETGLLTNFPKLEKLVTSRIILSADMPFKTPQEEVQSSSGELYFECASPKPEFRNVRQSDTITIRAFQVKFSEILVDKTVKQVNIFAQAFVIDADIDINYILVVRARNIYLNREKGTIITFSEKSSRVTTSVKEWQSLVKQGPYPDDLFQRISYMCAQVLINTKVKEKVNAGYSMLKSIATAPASNAEQLAMRRSATSLLARISGQDSSKAHYVPFYNKDHLIKQLDTYFTEISIYKDDYDRLQDKTNTAETTFAIASEMNKIHKDTIIAEATVAVENLEQSYQMDLQTQSAIEKRYLKARAELEESRVKAERDAKRKRRKDKRKARRQMFLRILGGLARIILGDPTGIIDIVSANVDYGISRLQGFYKLLETIKLIDEIMKKTTTLMAGEANIIYEAEDQIMVDIEAMIATRVTLVEWKALQKEVDIYAEGLDFDSSDEFRSKLAEYCTWGEALTEIMISTAETLRALLEAKSVLDLRLEQESRTNTLLESALHSVNNQKIVLHAMEEQVLDVTVDLNEILMQFCLAYFYETLQPCKDNLRPSYQESMKELLLKINTAKRDGLYIADLTSSVSRALMLTDKQYAPAHENLVFKDEEDATLEEEYEYAYEEDYDSGVTAIYDDYDHENNTSVENVTLTCKDQVVCPVTYFTNHKTLVISLSPDHADFRDLRKYRVNEIFLTLLGLSVPNAAEHMKVYLSTSGLFLDQREKTFNFVTRPIQLAFERELDSTGHLTVHADFPDEVHRITPFTKWVLTLSSERSSDLDLSSVTAIRMRFDGTAIILPEM